MDETQGGDPDARRAVQRAQWRAYYRTHREAILAKNRAWAKANRARATELARAARARQRAKAADTLDCG